MDNPKKPMVIWVNFGLKCITRDEKASFNAQIF